MCDCLIPKTFSKTVRKQLANSIWGQEAAIPATKQPFRSPLWAGSFRDLHALAEPAGPKCTKLLFTRISNA